MIDHRVRAIQLLLRAEAEIALLERTRPVGLAHETARLLAAWRAGRHESPRLRYARSPELGQLLRALGILADQAEVQFADGAWVADRARELMLEARLVESIGRTRFIALACQRHVVPRHVDAVVLEAEARQWIEQGADSIDNGPRFLSEDRAVPESLWSVTSRRMGALGVRARLRADPDLVSIAACGEDLIVIRAGAWLTERAAQRIAEHETVGHLLPRVACRNRSDILRCGCARATDDEEGRALLIEERQGLMDSSRRAELGVRHLACAYMRRGATFVDAVRCLLELGAPLETAIRAMLRAVRGGGLGRELVYLPSMQRLRIAFSEAPELEQWFRLGRASLDYALWMQARR
ncbi:MAG TPA: tyrosine/phenylalanine carboxypeptidase domain-containing protein [Polyangiaceae bacterium]|nr:tyrosine/phenylalanine carboxypeptidase domain-containing protein [Polyangiaceae bacterium]